jgi:nucleoside-diphosphate-sugar epimerase
VPITFADVSKAGRDLDYHPQTSLAAGLRKFADWYQLERSSGRDR